MLIADENIPIEIIKGLRKSALDTFSIFDNKRGISDKEIIVFVQNLPRIIITEDKDFGDLVFACNQKKVFVILLRYHYSELKNIESILIDFLKNNVIEQHSFLYLHQKVSEFVRFRISKLKNIYLLLNFALK